MCVHRRDCMEGNLAPAMTPRPMPLDYETSPGTTTYDAAVDQIIATMKLHLGESNRRA